MTIVAPWQALANKLRQRDRDPAYASAPILDPYARISRNPETGEMEKTDRQLADVLKIIEARHARLGEVLRDDNISAWRKGARRIGWNELLRRLEGGESNGVVVWHTDRLMRRMDDLEKIILLADTRGVQVGSCFGEYDLASSDDRFTLRVLTAAAQKEADNVSRRQKRKHEARRAAGRSNGGTRPFGFPGKGSDDAQVAAERVAVAAAIQAHLDGTSLSAIVRKWNEAGTLTTRGNAWTVTALREALGSARNAGLIEVDGIVTGRFTDREPIISEAQLGELRAQFASRGRGRPRSGVYALSGVLKCATCGQSLVGSPNGQDSYDDGTPRRVYRCQAATVNARACGKTQIDFRIAEDYVRSLVIAELSDPLHVTMIARQSEALAAVESQLADRERTAVELSRRLGEGKFDLDRYDAAIAPLEKAMADLTAQKNALLAAGAGQGDSRALAVSELEAIWAEATADERRRLTQRAFPFGVAVYPRAKNVHWSRVLVSDRVAPIRKAL